MVKRFESEDRGAPAGTRTGPRARAAQERKFGDAKFRGPSRGDPYQRAERPARPGLKPAGAGPGPGRDAPYGERLRVPARSAGITLDPDVARVFRDSEAVNEALRLVIRLARFAGGGVRPAFNRPGAPSGPRSGTPSRPRSGAPTERYARDKRPRERRAPAPPVRREPKFEDSE